MSEENTETTPKSSESVEPAKEQKDIPTAAPKMFTIDKRQFDISTPEGFAAAQAWQEAADMYRGRMANTIGELRDENGQLKKEVEPLRKYNLTNATVDEVKILKDVEGLRSEGNHSDADKLMFELYRQTTVVSSEKLEKERLWNDYKAANAKVFEVLPEDMAKDYIFKNYSKELAEEKDPFGLIDRVLKPKISKHLKQEEPKADLPPAVVGASQAKTTSANKAEEKVETSPWKSMLDEMGFK